MLNFKPIFYHIGYSKIASTQKEEVWDYVIQLHKNQNGKHWDFRLARPDEEKAFSWSMKKLPFAGSESILTLRTHDHERKAMNFQGRLTTRSGYGMIKTIQKGKTRIRKIDENGIEFEMNSRNYRLRPLKKKRYLLEKL